MISKTTKITNEMGFHMRPANVFVTAMTKYASDIELVVDNKRINGKSIMNIMAAGIKCGTEINLICDGEDEADAMETISKAIESGLGEM